MSSLQTTTLINCRPGGMTIFFGEGPLNLSNGDRNPLARGVLLTNATIGLIRALGGGWTTS